MRTASIVFLTTVALMTGLGANLLRPPQLPRVLAEPRLDPRIPAPNPAQYRAIREARDWLNPYLDVSNDGYRLSTPCGIGSDTREETMWIPVATILAMQVAATAVPVGVAATSRDGQTCVAMPAPALASGTALTLVRPDGRQSVLVAAIVGSAPACERLERAMIPGPYYLVKPSASTALESGTVWVAFVGRLDARRLGSGAIEVPLSSAYPHVQVRSCTSREGVHLTVWSGTPLTSQRLWHQYYYLGYDVEPSCDDRDTNHRRAPGEADGQPVRVGSILHGDEPVKRVQPVLPPEAASRGIVGPVLLEVLIGESGNVSVLGVVRGHPLLDAIAKEAVVQWKYRPVVINGRTVPIVKVVAVSFRLKG